MVSETIFPAFNKMGYGTRYIGETGDKSCTQMVKASNGRLYAISAVAQRVLEIDPSKGTLKLTQNIDGSNCILLQATAFSLR